MKEKNIYIKVWCRISVDGIHRDVECTVSQNAKSIYGKRGNTFGPYFTSKKIMKEIKG